MLIVDIQFALSEELRRECARTRSQAERPTGVNLPLKGRRSLNAGIRYRHGHRVITQSTLCEGTRELNLGDATHDRNRGRGETCKRWWNHELTRLRTHDSRRDDKKRVIGA